MELAIFPNFLIRSVNKGTFSQSHEKFWESAGFQCAAMSLMSICWTKLKRFTYWREQDLDEILNFGNELYRVICEPIGRFRYLEVGDLPNVVTILNENFNVSYELKTGFVTTFDGCFTPSLVDMTNLSESHCPITGFLFFICDMVLAIFLNNSSSDCYLFDSHSRNANGLPCPNGTSVFINFDSLTSLQNYLYSNYCLNRPYDRIWFQIQQIEVQLALNAKNSLAKALNKNRSKAYYQKNKDKIKLNRKRTYAKDPSTKKNQSKKAYAENRENILKKAKQTAKQTYLENPDAVILRAKQAYKANPEPTISRAKQAYVNNPDIKEQNRIRNSTNRANAKQSAASNFQAAIWEGPFYKCVICNRTHYLKSVKVFNCNNYPNLDVEIVTDVTSFDDKKYICITCHNKLKKDEIPCQSVRNKLEVAILPQQFSNLRELEKTLVAKRILFKKVVIIIGKGDFPKVKGTLCNIPVNAQEVANTLPRQADSNGLLVVKLKRQLIYESDYIWQQVRPNIVMELLNYLKENNPLYRAIQINHSNIDENLVDLDTDQNEDNLPEENSNNNNFENVNDEYDDENPQAQYQVKSNHSVLISAIPHISQDENLIVAPGQNQSPLSMLTDEYCEELAFPHLFPTGKFGYKVQREIPLSPSKYFNQRLLNYSQNFTSDSNYIFFARALLEHMHIQNSINIAMRIMQSTALTAGHLQESFNETISSFVSDSNAYKFMKSIRGSPAYWKQFLIEVLAMVKQLGLPSYFFTLSCADLKWDELIYHIARLKNITLTKEDIANMNYHDRTPWLNANPVLLARHFQYCTQLFFKNILLNGPLGKTEYYAYRVEFQHRGSPHIHGFLWIKDFPELTSESREDYINYLDRVISTKLPDLNTKPELYQYVKTYQIHHHSKTCYKYKKSSCRFHYGKFFTDRAIISQPLSEDEDFDQRQQTLEWRQGILSKVKEYINENLYPWKKNIIDPSKENYEEPMSICEILSELEISESEYYRALSISPDNDFQIHFKRPPNSCFVNNYFCEGLLAWQANIDIQPIFNHYKAVTYMCSYFSKTEESCTLAMMQAVKEALEQNHPYRESMKKIALAYAKNRECSVQEAVYHCLPELHLRRVFPAVVFANSNLPEDRYRMLKSREEIDELPADSNDIYKKGDIERYLDRPNQTYRNGKYGILDSFYFVEFLANYDLVYQKENPEYQPDELQDDLLESNHSSPSLPHKFSLMNSKEVFLLRKVKKVVRYGIPKKREKNPEKYAHHLLALFYPFRKESDLKSGNPPMYCNTLNDPYVMETVNRKRLEFEPFAEMVDEALIDYSVNAEPTFDAEGQVENDETNVRFPNDDDENNVNDVNDVSSNGQSSSLPINLLCLADAEICQKINSLNSKQREIFNIVFNWAQKTVKYSCLSEVRNIDPLYIFLLGSGGCGKSHLIKTIYHAVSKTFMLRSSDLMKPRILLLAPTGIAAINIDGTTIHTGFCISPNTPYHKLADKQRSDLRKKFSDLKLVVIDEISMVSSDLFYKVSLRLNKIFGSPLYSPFAGLSVIACGGDLFQLPPVKGKPVYHQYENPSKVEQILQADLWHQFKYVELNQIMRQNDQQFIEMLNRIRIGEVLDIDIELLSERFVNPENVPDKSVLRIFAENAPANRYNESCLDSISSHLYVIPASDVIPQLIGIPSAKINTAQNRRQQETGGLARELKIKVGARVMLTANIDLSDKLINGLMGTVCHVKVVEGSVKVIYVKFENESAGMKAKQRDDYSRLNNCVPIQRAETQIKIDKHLTSSTIIKRTQFPICLSWACTIHKVQGLSLLEAVISFDLEKQKFFNQGQLYVALSCVISLIGLYLIGTFDVKEIRVNESAKLEYQRLREESALSELPKLCKSDETFTIVLSNVRSLRKHIDDIFSDQVITDADIIGFTETGLLPQHDTELINNKIQPFQIIYNTTDSQPECSIATCYLEGITINDHIALPLWSLLNITKNKFSADPIKVLLLYKKNNTPANEFYDCLFYFSSQADIIMGDFNINGLTDQVNKLANFLSDFQLIHNEPTHLQGGLLDHVYIRKLMLQQHTCNSIIHPVFYSDHDVVKFQLSKYDIDFGLHK